MEAIEAEAGGRWLLCGELINPAQAQTTDRL